MKNQKICIEVPDFQSTGAYWMYVDLALTEKLSMIQRQGPHWEGDPAHLADPAEREELVEHTRIELVAALAAATHAIRLKGYPQAAAQGEMLLTMVQTGDVREHEVREAIDTFCRQFYPAHVAATQQRR